MGMGFLTLMVLLPIAVILVLLLKRVPTHLVAILGVVLTALIALVFFDTPLLTTARISLMAVFQSFPFTIMMITSILLVSFMEATGSIKRLSVFVKTFIPTSAPAQIMALNLGVGTGLVSTGATPNAILPPLMKAKGYSNFLSVALPALGFDALCTYSMLAAPLVVYADIVGIELVDAAKIFTIYLPIVSTTIAFAMLYLVGKFKFMLEGFIHALVSGLVAGFTAMAFAYIPALHSGIVLTGVFAGILVVAANVVLLKVRKITVIDRSVLTEEDLEVERNMSMGTALSPLIILVAMLLIVNFVPPIYDFLAVQLAMPVSVIPGQTVKLRMLWNAYTFVALCIPVSMIWLRPNKAQLKETFSLWIRRFPLPVISATGFFIVAMIMSNSGLEPAGDVWAIVNPMHNMVSVFALQTAELVGAAYPLITAPLGLLGGFVSSSEASTLAMFARYNIVAADALGLNALVVTAAMGIGAGLSSVVSPSKVQSAAAMIDAIGEEHNVLRRVFPIVIVLIAVAAVTCFIYTRIL